MSRNSEDGPDGIPKNRTAAQPVSGRERETCTLRPRLRFGCCCWSPGTSSLRPTSGRSTSWLRSSACAISRADHGADWATHHITQGKELLAACASDRQSDGCQIRACSWHGPADAGVPIVHAARHTDTRASPGCLAHTSAHSPQTSATAPGDLLMVAFRKPRVITRMCVASTRQRTLAALREA